MLLFVPSFNYGKMFRAYVEKNKYYAMALVMLVD